MYIKDFQEARGQLSIPDSTSWNILSDSVMCQIWYKTLENQISNFSTKMIVNVKRVTGNTYDIKIYRGKANGGYDLSCSQRRNTPNPISNVTLQSHWCSGVRFTQAIWSDPQ